MITYNRLFIARDIRIYMQTYLNTGHTNQRQIAS